MTNKTVQENTDKKNSIQIRKSKQPEIQQNKTTVLQHSARKRGGLILQTSRAHTGLYQKGKTSLDLDGARAYGVLGCSGISSTICKQSAPRSRQITTPASHHSNFTGLDALPDTKPTVSKQ